MVRRVVAQHLKTLLINLIEALGGKTIVQGGIVECIIILLYEELA